MSFSLEVACFTRPRTQSSLVARVLRLWHVFFARFNETETPKASNVAPLFSFLFLLAGFMPESLTCCLKAAIDDHYEVIAFGSLFAFVGVLSSAQHARDRRFGKRANTRRTQEH